MPMDRGQKDELVDTTLEGLCADETLSTEEYQRAWVAFRKLTEADLMLVQVITERMRAKSKEAL